MSNDNRAQKESRQADKKAAVLGTEKKSNLSLVVMIVSGLLFAGGVGAYLFPTGQQSPGPVSGNGTAIAVTSGNVTLPAAIFEDGKARHYEFRSGDRRIRYFVLKSSDGAIRAAFDACDVCWPAGKGYFQEGDRMVCRNCGKKFASVLVNEVKGGCNPAPLERRVEDGKVIIPIKAIEAGAGFFNFSKGV
jgi:uncharacterized membrane protein